MQVPKDFLLVRLFALGVQQYIEKSIIDGQRDESFLL